MSARPNKLCNERDLQTLSDLKFNDAVAYREFLVREFLVREFPRRSTRDGKARRDPAT